MTNAEANSRKRADDVGIASDLMKVKLTCPACNEAGLVDWKNLKNGIGCPKCGCQFIIGRNGQILSQADLPHVRYTCPRCKNSDAIPAMLSNRGAHCKACKLELSLGPDRRLYSVQEAEEMWRVAKSTLPRKTIFERISGVFTTGDGHVRKPVVAGSVSATALLLLVVAWGILPLFDRSPETLARRFVASCLAGEWDIARKFVEDDAVQQAEFDRWRVRHFPSILDKHRPAGDRVIVDISVLDSEADRRAFLATLKSPFLGARSQVQYWCMRDGNWLFDAKRTLAQAEPARRPSRTGRPPRVPRRSALSYREAR